MTASKPVSTTRGNLRPGPVLFTMRSRGRDTA